MATAFPLLLAARPQAQQPTATPQLAIEKYTLTNGLEVIFHEDHRAAIVTVSVRYRVPATPNPPNLTGLGHIMEHVLLSAPLPHISDAERDTIVNATGGGEDGATGLDGIYFWAYAPSQYLTQLLWLRSEQMAFARPKEQDMARERSVVMQEYRLRIENARYGPADHAMWSALFPPPHPYREVVIGSAADISKANLHEVLDVYRKYYRPANAALVIDGDFDPAHARDLVSRYFGTLQSGSRVPPPTSRPPPPASPREISLRSRSNAARISTAWVTPPIYKQGDAEIELLSHALGDGNSSILHRHLVRQLQVASETSCSYHGAALGSTLRCDAVLKPGTSVEQGHQAMDVVFDNLRRDGPPIEDLRRAKARWMAKLFRSLEIGSSRANLINQYNQLAENPEYLGMDLQRHEAATVESARQVAQEHLASDHAVLIIAQPEGK